MSVFITGAGQLIARFLIKMTFIAENVSNINFNPVSHYAANVEKAQHLCLLFDKASSSAQGVGEQLWWGMVKSQPTGGCGCVGV